MLGRAQVSDKDTVLIPGASGGVGSALVQLATYRGARVIAMTSQGKEAELIALGADKVVPRAAISAGEALPVALATALAAENITVIADVVGGLAWPALLIVCSAAGAIPVLVL